MLKMLPPRLSTIRRIPMVSFLPFEFSIFSVSLFHFASPHTSKNKVLFLLLLLIAMKYFVVESIYKIGVSNFFQQMRKKLHFIDTFVMWLLGFAHNIFFEWCGGWADINWLSSWKCSVHHSRSCIFHVK